MESPTVDLEDNDRNTFKILISTDNHLGYAEKDPIRGNDSFETFDEILKLAKKHKVDLLLLGGDLFHENKPSRKTMFRTMNSLRKNCMGNGNIEFQIVSDESLNFPNFGVVNYKDPNYNVELPIFSIHGNHDDPTREGGVQALAALDLLSVANLINYFGKSEKVDDIEILPILLYKGNSKIAIYGLGNMRDERLNRMFIQKKVKFRRPSESPEEWFNIFVVHQNRDNRGRGVSNCVQESFIPEFIDFVIWGHEHECRIIPEESLQGNFFITQPGSSVATSLAEGESKLKQIGLLEIKDQQFRMTPIPLETVRPFIIKTITLSEQSNLDPNDAKITEKINVLLNKTVNKMINDYHKEQQQQSNVSNTSQKDQVLVRLRVDHSGFPKLINNVRFGVDFVDKVANPSDILLFTKKEQRLKKGNRNTKSGLFQPILPDRLGETQVEDLILKKLQEKLVLLEGSSFNEALVDFVGKNIPSAMGDFVDKTVENMQRYLNRLKEAGARDILIDTIGKKTQQTKQEQMVAQEEKNESTSNLNQLGEDEIDENEKQIEKSVNRNDGLSDLSDDNFKESTSAPNYSKNALSSSENDDTKKNELISILSSDDQLSSPRPRKQTKRTTRKKSSVKKERSSSLSSNDLSPSPSKKTKTIRRKQKSPDAKTLNKGKRGKKTENPPKSQQPKVSEIFSRITTLSQKKTNSSQLNGNGNDDIQSDDVEEQVITTSTRRKLPPSLMIGSQSKKRRTTGSLLLVSDSQRDH